MTWLADPEARRRIIVRRQEGDVEDHSAKKVSRPRCFFQEVQAAEPTRSHVWQKIELMVGWEWLVEEANRRRDERCERTAEESEDLGRNPSRLSVFT